jgi:signal transduction histidine kinase
MGTEQTIPFYRKLSQRWTKTMAQLSPTALDTITTRFLILFLFLMAIPLCALITFTVSMLASHLAEVSGEQITLSQNLFQGALAETEDTLGLLAQQSREQTANGQQNCLKSHHLMCLTIYPNQSILPFLNKKPEALSQFPDLKAVYDQVRGQHHFFARMNHQLYLFQKSEPVGKTDDVAYLYGLPLDDSLLNRIYQRQTSLQTVIWILDESEPAQKQQPLRRLAQSNGGKNLEDASRLLALLGEISPQQKLEPFEVELGTQTYQISQNSLYSLDNRPIARVVHILPLKQSRALLNNYYLGIYVIVVASLIFSVLLAMIAARTITQPLLKLITQVNTLSRENVTKEGDKVQISGVQEIWQLGEAFNRMILRLRQEHKMKDDFVATLTHDLKVPLLAEKQTLFYFIAEAYGTLNAEQKEVLGLLKSSNGSCLSLVNGLLEVYRYEAGNVSLVFDPLNLARLIEDTMGELRSLAQEKSIQMELRQETKGEDASRVYADALEIKRVLHNLISNAIINTPIHGKIECRITDSAHYGSDTVYKVSSFQHTTLKHPVQLTNKLLVVIQDSGIGFSSNDLPHLFQQFAASKGRNPMSIGLGLFNCFQVLCAHHNPLWVESTEGEGSAVSFTLATSRQTAQERRLSRDRRQRS